MKIKDVIEFLGTFNPESSLELSKVIAIKQLEGLEDPVPYIVRLDFPIMGVAEKDGEVLLLIEAESSIIAFGKDIRRLDGSALTQEDIDLIRSS